MYQRGVIIRNKITGICSIFISCKDNIVKSAIVEDIFNEIDLQFNPSVTSIVEQHVDDIELAESWPSYFNSINIS